MSVATAASKSIISALDESRRYCSSLTKLEAKNFYYGLKLLPQAKRRAMFALYAYMRLVDDIADGQDSQTVQDRIAALDAWRESTEAALSGRRPEDGHSIWPAFTEMVLEHGVPPHLFYDVIAGQRQDLDSAVFETFEELKQYCYRVAGVVGVASVYIWGFEGGEATQVLAIDRGIAFQLTNILRDLREDADRGRIYLPRQELIAAGVDPSQLKLGQPTDEFCRMMQQQIARARGFYESSAPLESLVSADSRPTLAAMTEIYSGLLEKMSADPGRVLRERVSLSALTKIRIAWRAARAR